MWRNLTIMIQLTAVMSGLLLRTSLQICANSKEITGADRGVIIVGLGAMTFPFFGAGSAIAGAGAAKGTFEAGAVNEGGGIRRPALKIMSMSQL